MGWSDVGGWIKDNAGPGAVLVGSLLTGNAPGAIAAGVALVSGATGTTDPGQALLALQQDPATMVRLKELAVENDQNIRRHIEEMTRLDLEDQQKAHHETQETIRQGDKSEHWLNRATRPGQSWVMLVCAAFYGFNESPDPYILGAFLTLPFTYAGLRQTSKLGEIVAKIKGVKS
jgi:hypothetical protein